MSKKRSRYEVQAVDTSDLKRPDEDKPILGADLLPYLDVHFNTLICGLCGTGKTTALYHILEHTIDDRAEVFVFCSTHDIDRVWIKMIEMLEDKGCKVMTFDHIMENGVSVLGKLIDKLKEEDDEKKNQNLPHSKLLKTSDPDKEPGQKKKKYYATQTARRVFLIDDENIRFLRGKDLEDRLKKHRHIEGDFYVLTQHPVHIPPSCFDLFHQLFLFRGYGTHYIETLYDRIHTDLTKEEFVDFYRLITEEKHHFLKLVMREEDTKYFDGFNPQELHPKELFQ